jgi:S1-C subfamily serine protease
MTESNHYEPTPEPRPQWQPGNPVEASTPERWFEPPPASASEPGDRRPSRGLIGVVLATSMAGAILGGSGTFLLLRTAGALDPAVTPAPASPATAVSIRSESDAVVSAVAAVGPSVVTLVAKVATGQSVGSGIVYDATGWVLTNKHVIGNAKTVSVRLQDGRTLIGSVYGIDTLTDLAIIRIGGATGLKAAPMGSSADLKVGQLAIAIGSPLGVDYPNSVTSGIVSALGRDVTVTSDVGLSGETDLHGLIQTDAAINSGNSGGPLVDGSGRVVGVTTAVADTAQGIGFAIPIDVAKPIMQQALAGAALSRPFIGISYVALDAGLATKNNLPLDHGAWIHKEDGNGASIDAVVTDGPADQAGIKTGDIIVAIEGQAIDSSHSLEDVLVRYAPGRIVSIDLFRGNQQLTVQVKLGTRPAPAT